ncbi:hypothetical protein BDE36_3337 [Arcticibacter tournemirensis]|nr:hypothetical protein BDE36_3337 [Arcticibacter tournemirensis]
MGIVTLETTPCFVSGSEGGVRPRNFQPSACNARPSTHNPSRNPLPSDIFGIYFLEKGWIAYVGFVDGWTEKYHFEAPVLIQKILRCLSVIIYSLTVGIDLARITLFTCY